MTRDKEHLGIMVPSSNRTLEPDCALLAPPEVTLHFTRFGGYDVDAVPDNCLETL